MAADEPCPPGTIEYNCTRYGGAAGKCFDTGSGLPEFAINYYNCNGDGYCQDFSKTHYVSCYFLGYKEGTGSHRCCQKPPVTGFTDVQVCHARCGYTYTWILNTACSSDEKCEERDGYLGRWCKGSPPVGGPGRPPIYGITGSGQGLENDFKWFRCTRKESCPAAGTGGDPVGDAICCYGSGGGGGGGCTPQCPANKCTVTDNCVASNRGMDPEYEQYVMTEQGGPLCKGQDAYCIQENGCGGMNICNTASCYKPETNTSSAPTPTSIKIYESMGAFEWTSFQPLSTNPDSPTLIRYPYPTSTMRTELNDPGLPSGARDIRARLAIGGTQIGDPRMRSEYDSFHVFNSYPKIGWLTKGYYGQYTANFDTLNKCDDNWKTGDSYVGNFKVNTPPKAQVTVVGDSEEGGTEKGCIPEERYTSNEANRTLTFTVKGKDVNTNLGASGDDANHRINGAMIWLIKEGQSLTDNERNRMHGLGPGQTLTDAEKIGVLVNTAGGIYKSNNGSGALEGWGRDVPDGSNIQQPNIYINVNGERKVLATITTRLVSQASGPDDETIIEITLRFEKDSPISGKYNIWVGMFDNLTLFPTQPHGYFVDIRSVKETTQAWNFDFQKPTLKNISLSPLGDQRRLLLSWTSEDNVPDGIRPDYTVVNVYKSGQDPASEIKREDPEPRLSFIPVAVPTNSDDIGKLPVTSGWLHGAAGTTSLTSNILDNAEGRLHYYITVYDKACNYAQTGEDGTPRPDPVELDKWIVSKGGILFSDGNIRFPTKLNHPYEFANLGTELISSGSSTIEEVNEYTSNHLVNPAVARVITDINSSGSAALFDKLVENFEEMRPRLTSIEAKLVSPFPIQTYLLTCENPLGCIWEPCYKYSGCVGDEAVDVVPQGAALRYLGNIILVPPEGHEDMYIKGIIEGNDSSSLFIFTEGSVNIGGSVSTDERVVVEDQIDAFIIAKENINILPETVDGYYHDRVTVEGGLIAFGLGEASTPAFSLRRSLGLHNVNHPVLSVTYHPKYAVSSTLFFGLQNNAYKREVGFKPG
ncbi:MAG TPA: hypothetical protein VJY47_01275 [Candidatus Dojkabacteria bacterium]|nr:hypothetical protein [Candidatus Dojkabacteria bacterium]